MPASDDISTSKRELVARVATLELLVADLIHILWRVDPEAMDRLAGEAGHDLEIQNTRVALPVPEHRRDRLFTVLQTRRRMLKPKPADFAAHQGGLGG